MIVKTTENKWNEYYIGITLAIFLNAFYGVLAFLLFNLIPQLALFFHYFSLLASSTNINIAVITELIYPLIFAIGIISLIAEIIFILKFKIPIEQYLANISREKSNSLFKEVLRSILKHFYILIIIVLVFTYGLIPLGFFISLYFIDLTIRIRSNNDTNIYFYYL